jgi:predicted Zn-dependent protease
MMDSPIRLAASCSLAIVLCGCAAQGGALSEVQDTIAAVVLPPEQAAQLGEKMAQQIEAKQPLAGPALQQRVSRVGQQVVAAARNVPSAYDFEFKVLQAPETLNAFALPGGKIYATSGLLRAAESDAQLASVLAHEVAHVTERHIADRMATTYGAQLLSAAALGSDPGALVQLASSVLQQGFVMKYSREQELQADRVGIRMLDQAGYDPHAAISMFRKLGQGGGAQAPAFFSSHPPIGDRIDRLQDIIARRD